MPLIRLVVGTVTVSAFLVGSTAQASGIRECGSYRTNYVNITTRAVPCTTARSLIRAWEGKSKWNNPTKVWGMKCRSKSLGLDHGDIRCTGSNGRVVHWHVVA